MLPRIVFSQEKEGYTVGVKRSFFPGYKKYQVKAHSWENFRFILNLVNGEQVYIPGFQAKAVKVYSNFWNHVNKQRDKQEASRPVYTAPISIKTSPVSEARAGAEAMPEYIADVIQPELEDLPPLKDNHVSQEARRRASQRVRGILQGSELEGSNATRSN